jgi:hypothetical protein
MSIYDAATKPVVRNALLRASKRNLTIVQGPCTQIGACGGWVDSPTGKKRQRTAAGNTCCLLCALVIDLKVKLTAGEGSDAEQAISDALGVDDRNWVISLAQGFDGEVLTNGEQGAYKMGQHFWRLFSE